MFTQTKSLYLQKSFQNKEMFIVNTKPLLFYCAYSLKAPIRYV